MPTQSVSMGKEGRLQREAGTAILQFYIAEQQLRTRPLSAGLTSSQTGYFVKRGGLFSSWKVQDWAL